VPEAALLSSMDSAIFSRMFSVEHGPEKCAKKWFLWEILTTIFPTNMLLVYDCTLKDLISPTVWGVD
jgi:hypothetical protein